MDYIRIKEVNNLQALELIKLKFNKEGVRYKVLFERTLHLDGIYALGQRGAIIEVWEEHLARATMALEELGYNTAFQEDEQPSAFLLFFDQKTKYLPLLGKIPVSLRWVLVIVFGVFLVLLGVLWGVG